GSESGGVANGDLVGIRRRRAPHARAADSVWTLLGEMERGEIGATIGREVGARVSDFVDELFGYGGDGDASSHVGVFGDDEGSIGVGFDDGIADVGEVGDGFPIVLTIAA